MQPGTQDPRTGGGPLSSGIHGIHGVLVYAALPAGHQGPEEAGHQDPMQQPQQLVTSQPQHQQDTDVTSPPALPTSDGVRNGEQLQQSGSTGTPHTPAPILGPGLPPRPPVPRHSRSASVGSQAQPAPPHTSHNLQRVSLERAPSHILAGDLSFTPVAWTVQAQPEPPPTHPRPRAMTAHTVPAQVAVADNSQTQQQREPLPEPNVQMQSAPSLSTWTAAVPAMTTGSHAAAADVTAAAAGAAADVVVPAAVEPAPVVQLNLAADSIAQQAGNHDLHTAAAASDMAVVHPGTGVNSPGTTPDSSSPAVMAVLDQPASSADHPAIAAASQMMAGGQLQLSPRSPRKAAYQHTASILSQTLFLTAYATDIAAAVVLIESGWPKRFWVPILCFLTVPVVFMGVLLLLRNGWLAVCLRYFTTLLTNEARALMMPRWYALDWLRVPTALLLVVMMAVFGSMVTGYCIICFTLTAIGCVPVMDFSMTLASWLPFGWPRFKQRDLLLIEQYKATRYTVQLLLQSIPQLVVMSLALTMNDHGEPHGNRPALTHGDRPGLLAALIISLSVAAANTLDKLWLLGEQLHLAVGRGLRPEASMRGKWGRLVAWVRAAGQAVDDKETADDVDTGAADSDADDGTGAWGMWWLLGGLSVTQACGRHFVELLRLQGAHKVPPTVMDSTLQHMLRSTSHFVMRGGGTLAPLPEEAGEDSDDDVLVDGVLPTPQSTAGGGAGGGGSGATTPRARRRRSRSTPVVAQGYNTLSYRNRQSSSNNSLAESESQSLTVTLIPHFLRPPGGGRLAPAQVLTVVREAMARYPRHAITTWAVEPPPGHACLSGIILDGVTRFKALQKLTICKSEVVGQGFRRVLWHLSSHPALTELRLTHVVLDAAALGALAQLVSHNTLLTTLEVSHASTHRTSHAHRGMQRVVRALKANRTLTSLTLCDCGLTTNHLQALCTAVMSRPKEAPVLRYLDVSGNDQCGPASAPALLDLLQTLCHTPQTNTQQGRVAPLWSMARVSLNTVLAPTPGATSTTTGAPAPSPRPIFGITLPWARTSTTDTAASKPAGDSPLAADAAPVRGISSPQVPDLEQGNCGTATPRSHLPVFSLVVSASQGGPSILSSLATQHSADTAGPIPQASPQPFPAAAATVTAPLPPLPPLSIRTRGSGRPSRDSQVASPAPAATTTEQTQLHSPQGLSPAAAALALLTSDPQPPTFGPTLVDAELSAIPEHPPGCFSGRPRWLGGRSGGPSSTPAHTTITIIPDGTSSAGNSMPLPKLQLPSPSAASASAAHAAPGTDPTGLHSAGASRTGSVTEALPLPSLLTVPAVPTPPQQPSSPTAAPAGGTSGSRLSWLLPSRHRRAASDTLPASADFTTLTGAVGATSGVHTPTGTSDGTKMITNDVSKPERSRGWFAWRNTSGPGKSSSNTGAVKPDSEQGAEEMNLAANELQAFLTLCQPPPATADPPGAVSLSLRDPQASHLRAQGLPVVLVARSSSSGSAAQGGASAINSSGTSATQEAQEPDLRSLLEQLASVSGVNATARGAQQYFDNVGSGGSAGRGMAVQLAVVCDWDTEGQGCVTDPDMLARYHTVTGAVGGSVLGLPRSLCSSHRLFGSLLVSLDLSCLGLGDMEAVLLGELVLEATGLKSLVVSHNRIRDAGAAALLAAVTRACTSGDNPPAQPPTDAPGPLAAAATGSASGATVPVVGATATAPAQAVASHWQRPLRLLDMSGNQLGDQGAVAIAGLLEAVNRDRTAVAAAAVAAVAAADAATATVDTCTAALTAAQTNTTSTSAPDSKPTHKRVLSFNWGSGNASTPAAAAAAEDFKAAVATATVTRTAAHAALVTLAHVLQRTPLALKLHSNHHPFAMESLSQIRTQVQVAARGPEVLLPMLPPAPAPSSASQPALPTSATALLTTLLGTLQFTPALTVQLQESSAGAGADAAKPATAAASALSAHVIQAGTRTGRHSRTPSHGSHYTEGSDGEGFGCGVCFDNPNNLLIKDCGHKLCVSCYRELVGVDSNGRGSARCPFCRGPIKGFEYRLGLGLDSHAPRPLFR